MEPGHLFGVGNGRQIHNLIFFQQQLAEGTQGVHLLLRKLQMNGRKPGQNGFFQNAVSPFFLRLAIVETIASWGQASRHLPQRIHWL